MDKHAALKALCDELVIGRVDPLALPLITAFNLHPDYYTTSSCSGRISLSAAATKKGDMELNVKWHRPVTYAEVLEAYLEYGGRRLVFLKQEPFIFHIACADLRAARRLLEFLTRHGIKRRGIFKLKPPIMVEFMGTEKIEMPLQFESIELAVEAANARLRRNFRRLERLTERWAEEFL